MCEVWGPGRLREPRTGWPGPGQSPYRRRLTCYSQSPHPAKRENGCHGHFSLKCGQHAPGLAAKSPGPVQLTPWGNLKARGVPEARFQTQGFAESEVSSLHPRRVQCCLSSP